MCIRDSLWGDFEHLHLGEREWDEAQETILERFYILNLETGALQTYGLSDQAYRPAVLRTQLEAAGFGRFDAFPAWAGLPIADAAEWEVTIAHKT